MWWVLRCKKALTRRRLSPDYAVYFVTDHWDRGIFQSCQDAQVDWGNCETTED